MWKNASANFGVQQLPLFNLLGPEELDWQVCLSRFEGKRRLDTKVPRKFVLGDVIVEVNGLKDAIGCDRILSGNGLRDAIW